ncbi:MAG: autotransporter domain-containing protein [Verrucomicrobiota bacterium]
MNRRSSSPRTSSSSHTSHSSVFRFRPWWTGLNSALVATVSLAALPVQGDTFTLANGGAWSSSATWKDSRLPSTSGTDYVEGTASGITVDLGTTNVAIGSLRVSVPASGSGSLTLTTTADPGGQFAPGFLSVGTMAVATGGTLKLAELLTVSVNRTLTLNGSGKSGQIEFYGTLTNPLDSEGSPLLDNNFNEVTGSVKIGSGIVVFAGVSTYTGSTELQAGKLVIAGEDGLGYTSGLIVSGGTLTADPLATSSVGRTISVPVSITGNAQLGQAGADLLTLSGGVDLGGGAPVLTVAGSVEIGSEITDGGSSSAKLLKAGSGKLILSATNSYSGGTELREGVLLVTAGDALGSPANGGPGGTLTVSGGTFQLGAEQHVSGLQITGGVLVVDPAAEDPSGVGSLIVQGLVIRANVADAATVDLVLADDPDGAKAVLTKDGVGTLTLSAANEFRGGTVLNAGTLIVANKQALGTGALTVSGGVLSANGTAKTIDNQVVIAGSAQIGTVGSGEITFAGRVSLNSATAVLNVVNETTMTGLVENGLTAPGDGGRLIKDGAGKLILAGTNTYSGGTELRAGFIQTLKDGALGTGAVVVNGGTLNVGGTTQNVRALKISGGAIDGTIGGKFVLNSGNVEANVGTNATIGVVIADGSSPVGVRKTGSGVLNLSAKSTYTGDTSIESGEVRVTAGDDGSASPLGAPEKGKVILSDGQLVVAGGTSNTYLGKDIQVISSGALIAESTALRVSKLSVASGGVLQVKGDISATAIDVAGRVFLSGINPLTAGSLSASNGAVLVWDKTVVSSQSGGVTPTKGIVVTGNGMTDLSAAKVEFSKAFLDQALVATSGVVNGQVNRKWDVGSLVESSGTIVAPTQLTQPGGVMKFSLSNVPGSTGVPSRIEVELERSAYEQFAGGKNEVAFARLMDNATSGSALGDIRSQLDAKISNVEQARAILKQANGGSTFASVSGAASQQALAVSSVLDSHLDNLGFSASPSSAFSMGVRVNGPSKNVVPSWLTPSGSSDRDWNVWTSGYGSWARIAADEATGQGKATVSGGGGALGVERRIGDFTAGVLVSIGEGVALAEDPALRVRSEQWNVGSFGSVNIGSVTLDASALWGKTDQDSRREVPGGAIATARYETQNWQFGAGVAVNLAPENSSWQIAPVARVKYVNASEDAFDETGSTLGIGSSGQNDRHFISKLGLRFAKTSQVWKTLALGVDGGAYWVHDYNAEGHDINFQIGGVSYQARTRDREADSTELNLGLQATFSEKVTLRISAQQDLSQDRTQTTGVFSIGYQF